MNFLEKLDFLMDKFGLTKRLLSQKSEIPYTTIDAWYKKGYEGLKLTTLRKLADFFNTTLDYWVVDEITDPNHGKTSGFNVNYDEMEHIKKYRATDQRGQAAVDYILNLEYDRTQEAVKESSKSYSDTIIPIFNAVTLAHRSGAAGAGIGESADNVDVVQLDYPADKVPAGTDYTINVTGDSMLPTFADGDVLFCQHTQELNYGDIGIFILNGETYVKEYDKEGLISHNPDKERYGIITIGDGDSLVVEGKVLGKL